VSDQAFAVAPLETSSGHPRSRFAWAYQRQDSTQTLREGIAEYYRSDPRLLAPRDLPDHARRSLLAHDAAHVVFGCDTSARGEIALSRWTLLGATDWIPIYARGLATRETRWLFVEFFKKLRPLSVLLGALDGCRAVYRSLRMTSRWPSYEYERYLDRPLDTLRRQFGIRVLH
jgi:hypothetical protein